jgi:hypothetical protein
MHERRYSREEILDLIADREPELRDHVAARIVGALDGMTSMEIAADSDGKFRLREQDLALLTDAIWKGGVFGLLELLWPSNPQDPDSP